MANNLETLQRTYDNYARIWLMLTEAIVSPTANAIDALTTATEATNNATLKLRLTHSLDGESYDFTGFQSALDTIMTGLRNQMQLAAGPFCFNVTGR